jgi:lipid II:glycine glycyltransferase (peptidoglycan interpeptide bridge formation enzyme)
MKQVFQIKEVADKNKWEDFLFDVEEKTFLQSWNWGEFQKMTGKKIYRLGVYEKNELIAVSLVVKIKAKRGTFLFLPHGPIINSLKSQKLNSEQTLNNKFQILRTFLSKLKEIAKGENCSFIRIATLWERNKENERIFKGLGFRNSPIHQHPELTWKLDISLSSDELLKNMRKTTRYLIKQGLKNPDLKIKKSERIEDIEIFNNLYQKTVSRHHFTPFSLSYLKNEFLAFSKDNESLIFLAYYKRECLASAIIIFWQNRAFYHQGASVSSKVSASYLLQWEAIKEAKMRDCKIYNFWGIAPIQGPKLKLENPNHPWAGLTLFKTGFGGYKKEYLKTQDLPLLKTYWLTFFFEKLRKLKRGL